MAAIVRLGDPISCGDIMGQGSGNVFANGSAVSRMNVDLTVGHCFSPVPIISASPNVFVNNARADRVGDPIPTHCCSSSCHSGVASNGSPNVFVNSGSGGPSPITVLLDQFKQPGVSRLQAAEQHDDDQGSDPIYVEYRKQAEAQAGYVATAPTFIEQAPPATKKPANVPSDCSDITAHTGPFPGSFQLSPNFTLSQVTTNTLISRYPLIAQGGLSQKDIVCNLRALCVNILEPLLTTYGSNLVVNSGFRQGTGRSQHYKGQAVDVSFKDAVTSDQFWTRAKEIKDNINYDQFIFEQNISIWYHISYNTEGVRRQVLTKPRGDTYVAGLQRIVV